METFKVRMMLNGDTALTVGVVIDLLYPSMDRRDATDLGKLDPIYSGKYLITAIRHRFGVKTHYTLIEAVKGTTDGGLGRV